MSEHYDQTHGPNGHAEHVDEDDDDLFKARGYRKGWGWFLLDDAYEGGAHESDARKEDEHKKDAPKEDAHQKDQPSAEKPLSPEDERKRKQRESKTAQREADKKAGWVQCNIKIWDDPDARKLMPIVGLRTREADFRAAIWMTLEDPYIVSLGARVHRLTGVRRFMMRLFVGPLKSSANS